MARFERAALLPQPALEFLARHHVYFTTDVLHEVTDLLPRQRLPNVPAREVRHGQADVRSAGKAVDEGLRFDDWARAEPETRAALQLAARSDNHLGTLVGTVCLRTGTPKITATLTGAPRTACHGTPHGVVGRRPSTSRTGRSASRRSSDTCRKSLPSMIDRPKSSAALRSNEGP